VAQIVILGAGLTGLSTAYHLERAGIYDYTIFEKDARPGGLLKSVAHEGFTFDYTGHLLHINNDYFKTFLHDIADLESNFLNIVRQSAIYSHNQLTNYPYQMNLYGHPTDVSTD